MRWRYTPFKYLKYTNVIKIKKNVFFVLVILIQNYIDDTYKLKYDTKRVYKIKFLALIFLKKIEYRLVSLPQVVVTTRYYETVKKVKLLILDKNDFFFVLDTLRKKIFFSINFNTLTNIILQNDFDPYSYIMNHPITINHN